MVQPGADCAGQGLGCRLSHQGLEDYAEAARRIRGALKVEGGSDAVEIDGLELSPDDVFRVGANELRRRGLQVRA